MGALPNVFTTYQVVVNEEKQGQYLNYPLPPDRSSFVNGNLGTINRYIHLFHHDHLKSSPRIPR
jgi:hypothetical protein